MNAPANTTTAVGVLIELQQCVSVENADVASIVRIRTTIGVNLSAASDEGKITKKKRKTKSMITTSVIPSSPGCAKVGGA